MATAAKPRADYPRPEINAPLVHKLLVAFIRNEFHKVGVKRAVLGVSGGVDSSLSAILGAQALGPENVLGIMMPYKTSSKESLEHARLLADRAGIKTIAVDISAADRRLLRALSRCRQLAARQQDGARADDDPLRPFGALGALVLGTCNKTELLLGYGTLYGDMASAVNPDRRSVQDAGVGAVGGRRRAGGDRQQAAVAPICGRADRRGRARLRVPAGRRAALPHDRPALLARRAARRRLLRDLRAAASARWCATRSSSAACR